MNKLVLLFVLSIAYHTNYAREIIDNHVTADNTNHRNTTSTISDQKNIEDSILYQDQFDSENNAFNPGNGFSVVISDKSIAQITGDGSSGPYDSIAYVLEKPMDIKKLPSLFIKVKGTNTPDFRIDLQDTNGYVTNLYGISTTLAADYTIHAFNFQNKFLDGGYAGPCKSADAPCEVDATKIKKFIFSVSPGKGKYKGTIDIDWISVGDSLEPISQENDIKIRYNQVAYCLEAPKTISITAATAFSKLPYTIKNKDGVELITGVTNEATLWKAANRFACSVDISAIDSIGTYTFQAANQEITFRVHDQPYSALSEAAFKYYYYNRASTSLDAVYAKQFSRPAGHMDTAVKIHASAATPERPEGTLISSSKGWYDAGDYNKYVVNSGISTFTLLSAFEHYPMYYQNKKFNIPESGNAIPDILDEALWNIEWLLTMQDPTPGKEGVYHKLTSSNFSGVISPNEDKSDRYVVSKSTAASLNFAAVMAVASRVYKPYETQLGKPGFSNQLLNAAVKAYEWAKANPTTYYIQPAGINTGQYKDFNVTDEFQWAATELLITTADYKYAKDIKLDDIPEGIAPSWEFVSSLALISAAHHKEILVDQAPIKELQDKLIETADLFKTRLKHSPMKTQMSEDKTSTLEDQRGSFVWGSNGAAANEIMMLIRAYELTKDSTYLSAAYQAMDYILGRNGTGYCFVTGFGDKKAMHPHHRISEADASIDPIPGMLVGGPHNLWPSAKNECIYTDDQPATKYYDGWCSYSTNEVTINWNAPLTYITNALHSYRSKEHKK
ncbi:glycoside hydrolase family 9 protein [Aquimarina pacifica]|uniref:glycoside hydrolase family 9 protein n=1 Tax=Aquimarina pacifica TaxID=1296415 RepID=UPI000472C0DE|nr:glycoside hydrolase family 9 protein [Aquimarina pacifica]